MGVLDGKVAIVRVLTGRVAYSQELLAELGAAVPLRS
jgi:hypothetical protein